MPNPGGKGSPYTDQTEQGIEEWLRTNVTVGTHVAIRHTQYGLLSYERGIVTRLGKGRFEVATQRRDGSFAESGESFYFSGKNCWHPKGQTRLVIPTEAVLDACEQCRAGNGHLHGPHWRYRVSF